MPVQARLGRQCCMPAQGSVMKAVLYACTGQCYDGSAVCLYRAVL